MITYHKSAFGLNLLFRVRGSAVYRSILPALLAVGLFFVVRAIRKNVGDTKIDQLGHPYAIGVLVASATFLIVFRVNQAYARYWEACSGIHHMMSKWLDATSHMGIYHLQCDHFNHIKPPSYYDHHELNSMYLTRDRERSFIPEEDLAPSNICETVAPNTNGLHNRKNVARDGTTGSPTTEPSEVASPPTSISGPNHHSSNRSHHTSPFPSGRDTKGMNGAERAKRARAVKKSINYVADKSKRDDADVFFSETEIGQYDLHALQSDSSGDRKIKGSSGGKAETRSSSVGRRRPTPLMDRPRLDGNWGALFDDGEKSTFFSPQNPDQISKRGFASLQGGQTPSLFLQELAHLSSLLVAVAFSTLRNDNEGEESPLDFYEPGSPWPERDPDKDEWLRLDGPGSLLRCVCTFFGLAARSQQERTRYNAARPLPVVGGVSENEIRFLQMARGASAKTQLCWSWLSEFCIREHLAGSTGNVGPPIISRTIQFLGDGMIFYNHARKVAYIPFPFPHAQISIIFVMVMIPALPVLMDQYTDHAVLGSVLTFFTVLCLCGINEVARELENPFRNVPNELPLVTLMAQYNEALLTLFAGYHPDHFWDAERMMQRHSSAVDTNTTARQPNSIQPENSDNEVKKLQMQLEEQAKIIAKLSATVGLDSETAPDNLV